MTETPSHSLMKSTPRALRLGRQCDGDMHKGPTSSRGKVHQQANMKGTCGCIFKPGALLLNYTASTNSNQHNTHANKLTDGSFGAHEFTKVSNRKQFNFTWAYVQLWAQSLGLAIPVLSKTFSTACHPRVVQRWRSSRPRGRRRSSSGRWWTPTTLPPSGRRSTSCESPRPASLLPRDPVDPCPNFSFVSDDLIHTGYYYHRVKPLCVPSTLILI
jgi:hypothetical protein